MRKRYFTLQNVTHVSPSKAQWSLHDPPVVTICSASGHYMYRQWSLYVPPVATICTASGHYTYRQLSLYVPSVFTICTASGHYMYRQLSLYVPPVVSICTASCHYMYRQWSVYVPPVVTICTASLTFNNSTFSPHSSHIALLLPQVTNWQLFFFSNKLRCDFEVLTAVLTQLQFFSDVALCRWDCSCRLSKHPSAFFFRLYTKRPWTRRL